MGSFADSLTPVNTIYYCPYYIPFNIHIHPLPFFVVLIAKYIFQKLNTKFKSEQEAHDTWHTALEFALMAKQVRFHHTSIKIY